MKRTLSLILCIALLVTMAIIPTIASAKSTGYKYVRTNDGNPLRLREDASTNAKVICKLPYRSYVLVYQYSSNQTWAYIEADNPNKKSGTVKGWVMAKFLQKSDPGPWIDPAPAPVDPTFNDINSAAKAIKYLDDPYEAIIVTKNPANFVHLRWFPSTSAAYADKYLCDTEITVLAQSKTWALVQVQETGYVGFILRSCVSPIAE